MPWFLLSFDGVYATPHYEYDPHNHVVLGGEIAYTAQEFVTKPETDLALNFGREIVQFYL